MDPDFPFKSAVMFRPARRVKRSDVVLVDHPQFGFLVRKVSAVSKNGRIGLRGLSRSGNSARKLGNVDRELIRGQSVLRMKWVRFLPYFGPDPIMPDSCCSSDIDQDEPEGTVETLAENTQAAD